MPARRVAFLAGASSGDRCGPLASNTPAAGLAALSLRVWAGLLAARAADHYHSASEHGIIGRRIDTVVADRFRPGGHRSGVFRASRQRSGAPRWAVRARLREDHWYVRCAGA